MNQWRELASASPWGVRAMPRGGVHDGYFYVISGRTGPWKIYSDTWRSPDGLNWECMSKKAGWGRRCYPEVDFVGGDIILTGGQSLTTFYNDAWRSSDSGRTWQQVCANAPWGPRAGHHTTVIDDVIYLFAGGMNSWKRIFYPELWTSADRGETWELRATLPHDMGRAGMQVVYIDGTIYFMGGDHDSPVFFGNWPGRRNDVWKSDDLGKTWECLGNATWSPRTGQQCIGVDGQIICIGGHVQGEGNRQALAHDMWVWNPKEGMKAWKKVSDDVWGCEQNPDRPGKSDFLLRQYDGKLWTLGGDQEVLSPWPQNNDVWVVEYPAGQ